MARRLTYRRGLELAWLFHVMDGALDVSKRVNVSREKVRAWKLVLQAANPVAEILKPDPPKPPTTSRPARTRRSPRRRRANGG
jgi:hypothetical protein